MTDNDKSDLRIMVNVTEDSGFGSGPMLKLDAHFVYLEGGKIRNPGSSSFDRDPYSDLGVHGQCDLRSSDFYGRQVEYHNVYSVDLRGAELMVKTLRSIEKKMDALASKFGQPADSAAQLVNLGHAVGVKDRNPFARLVGEARRWSYDDNEYRWMDADALRYHLDHQIAEFRTKHNPEDS